MKTLSRITALVILSLCGYAAQGQVDIVIPPTPNQYTVLGRGFNWGGSGAHNLNNNFIFNPINADEGFCLFLSNNNPTSSHSVSVSVSQTGDPALTKFTGFSQKWFLVPTNTSFPVTVPALGIVGINYKTTASAGITVSFSGATTQTGSPDTIDFFAVQTVASACGSIPSQVVQGPFQTTTVQTAAQRFPVLVGGTNLPSGTVGQLALGNDNAIAIDSPLTGSGILWFSGARSTTANQNIQGFGCLNGNTEGLCVMGAAPLKGLGGPATGRLATGLVTTDVLEAGTDEQTYGQNALSFYAQASTTNPAAGATILHQWNAASSTIDLLMKRMILSCSAACEIKLERTTAVGTTCTSVTPLSMQIFGGTRQAANASDLAQFACATAPTSTETFYDLSFTGVQVVDLTGWVNAHSTNLSGIAAICVGAVTGTVTATAQYVEAPN